ncbi:hypothetical protein EZV62_008897 [Acer yangbiense]|uniref:Uncharacterized protein n=1 Tax=Acer yangbiense TaxID=1000413 RepID=A0A5C7IF74_9ROSI|nr:hypothetical protein EZV62_008897 [Acer yangbiense]
MSRYAQISSTISVPLYGNSVHQKITVPSLYRGQPGDLSKNIIENIFPKALMDPWKNSRKIKRVLKVKNYAEILESDDLQQQVNTSLRALQRYFSAESAE